MKYHKILSVTSYAWRQKDFNAVFSLTGVHRKWPEHRSDVILCSGRSRGGSRNSLEPPPSLKYAMKVKQIGLSETKLLFHFHQILRKMR